MKIEIGVYGSIDKYSFIEDLQANKKFVVKHALGDIVFKIVKIDGHICKFKTNTPLCKSNGRSVDLTKAFTEFEWDMHLPFYVGTPTFDYSVIVKLTKSSIFK